MIQDQKQKVTIFISILEILLPANNHYDNRWLSIGYLITCPYATKDLLTKKYGKPNQQSK